MWCEKAKERVECEGERRASGRGTLVAARSVGALFDELDVVVAETPEEPLCSLERAGVVIRAERRRGIVDDTGEVEQERRVEWCRDVAGLALPGALGHDAE